MTKINNIEDFKNSIYASSPLFTAPTIEESYAKFVKYEEAKELKRSKKKAAKVTTFGVEDLKAKRVEVINYINSVCTSESLRVVMNEMMQMISDNCNTFENVVKFASAAIDNLEDRGVKVLSSSKLQDIEYNDRMAQKNLL